jgi:SulP family sulfate permease
LGGWLILEWLVRPWHRLSAMDNALVIAIPVLVVQFGYLEAAGFGVVASCIIFVVKYSRLRVIKHDLTRREYSSRLERSPEHSAFLKQNGDLIHIMWIQGYLFFGPANRLLEGGSSRISGAEGRSIRLLILDLSDVTGVDSS